MNLLEVDAFDVALAADAACVLDSTGRTACSGSSFGASPSLGVVVAITASDTTLCGLDGSGAARCLPGVYETGEALELAGPWLELEAGVDQVCGVTLDHEVRCTGDLELPGATHGLAVSADQDGVACALRDDGRAVCAGNHWDESEVVPHERFSMVSVGYGHACGVVDPSGAIVCWNWAMPPRR